ncbi:MAG: electron transfer flavoprotein subunit beta/FixA family protein [Bacteroidales bacterium]|nr:electron transfer flavoprotein subunit beta/FixA family protein [Bacteroidales bacterium]
MKILVLIGNVPDTTTKIKFNADKTAFDTNGVQWIINPWDELALTRAMELKETPGSGVESVTVANVGKQDTEATLRKALAIGADKAIRVDSEPKDAFFVASQLAQVAKGYDLVFAGIEASDYNGSAVGGMLAEMIGIQSVSGVSNLQIEGSKAKLVREIEGGSQTVSLDFPLLAIVQKGIAKEPRIPAMRGIMMARTKPLEVITPVDTDIRVSFASFDLPPAKAACKKFTEDQVNQLVHALRDEAKVL